MTDQAKSWLLVNLETKEYLYKNNKIGKERKLAECFTFDDAENKQEHLSKSGINLLIHGANTEL